ncbi:sensor histidine kinase [Paenibacillus sp. GCM10028914]|uniref:sensor histidine kinase n=1 Tax=Paenibacillus sp. GCM10028914 TaxID=3273416 RepID=UPI003616DF3F
MKIRTKIFVANMLVVTILLGVLTHVLIEYVSGILLDKAKENVNYSVSQLALNLDKSMKVYEQVIDSFYINHDIQEALLNHYESDAEAQGVYFDVVTPYMNVVRATTDTLNLMMYTNNPTFQFSDVKNVDDEIKEHEWYKAAHYSDKRLSRAWTYMGRSDIYKADVLRLVGKLYNIFNRSELFITLDVDQRVIQDLISKEDQDHRYIIALNNGQVIVDNALKSIEGLHIQDYGFYNDIAGSDDTSFMYTDDGLKYLVVSKTIDTRHSVSGMKIVSLVSIDQYISKVNQMKWIALALYLVSVLLCMIIIYAISTGLTKRLTVLALKIKEMNTDNLQSFIEVKGNDEISQVSYKFNQMMARMDMLIKQVYEAEIDRKELELKRRESELYALQAQINPHYLFNTLNAIRGNLLENGDYKNADIVKWFAQSFRNMLNQKSDVVKLGDELDAVNTYMNVQMFRYGNRLNYSSEVPEELRQFPIPRLALHTLLENAMIHALENNENDTVIKVRAEWVDERCYRVTVQDNGPGFSVEKLAEIWERLQNPDRDEQSRHLGLLNTQQRIKLTFGADFGLDIVSVAGLETRVSMVLPTAWHRQKEGENDVTSIDC